MPEISRFYGIVIRMYYNDHAPPHFHAVYGEHQAQIDIHTLSLFGGNLPPRALGMVVEWATQRRTDLLNDWDRARAGKPLEWIAPLA